MKPCQGCPWGGGRGVVRSPERTRGGIAVIGEGPAREEVGQGQCFVGPSGNELNKTLLHAGLTRQEVAIENAFACWKPDAARPHEEVKAVAACQERLLEFLDEVQPCGLILLGGRALRAITPGFVVDAHRDGLMRHRGSLWARTEVCAASRTRSGFHESYLPKSVKLVVATIHPAAIIRRARLEKFAAMGYRAVPALDARRLVEALRRGRQLAPLERQEGMPMWSGRDFVFDLETDDERRPHWVGVQSLDGGPVFGANWEDSRRWLEAAMRGSAVKVGHNICGFDLPVLMEQGFEIREPLLDTMALGGLCEPDMARGLYFQAAYYAGDRRPFWKELDGEPGLKREALRVAWRQTGVVGEVAEEEWLSVYNALDVDSTRLVASAQLARANSEGWL